MHVAQFMDDFLAREYGCHCAFDGRAVNQILWPTLDGTIKLEQETNSFVIFSIRDGAQVQLLVLRMKGASGMEV